MSSTDEHQKSDKMENTFLFVTCVNNEEQYRQCREHIGYLLVPSGYTIDFLVLQDAKSMAEGYNRALSHPAKYKIYLHQDTFLLNTSFLADILKLFTAHPTLGMIGVIGCQILPENGVWWEGANLIGKVVDHPGNRYRLLSYGSYLEPIAPVEAIDGLLMATQYDLPWRADLFDGFHFYDISQSQEFIKKGYWVGVPSQENPWCLHFGSGWGTDYPRYQQVFQDHYPLTSS